MAKKQKKRKGKPGNSNNIDVASPAPVTSPVASKMPEIPAFWVAVIIPVICLVGAWTYPPVATPMELKSYSSQIYLSCLMFFWFWALRKHTLLTLNFSHARLCFGLLFVFGTLSVLWANNPDFWVYKWNKWYSGLVIFLLGLHITQNEKNLDTVVNLSILGGLIVALIGIAQYLFGFSAIPQTSFPSSTFGNGNMAGQVMVLTAALPLYFLFKENLSKEKTWYYSLSLCILLTYTYYTRTRAVWIACGLEAFLILTFIFFDKTKRSNWLFWNKQKSVAGISSLVIFAVLINFNSSGFQPFWEIAIYELSSIATAVATSAEERGGQRYLIWNGVLQMVQANPFIGTGLGSFFNNVNTAGFNNYRILGVQRAHNDVFELAVELGAVGILLLLGIIITMCIQLYKLLLNSEGQKRLLYALLTIAVTGSMLNAQISFPYQLPVPLVIMPFFVSLIIAGSEANGVKTYSISVKKWFNKSALVASGTIFIFMLINDLAWFRDFSQLNKIVQGNITNTAWKPVNPIYNQAYITAARSVGQALRGSNRDQLSLYLMDPIIKYWPDTSTNTLLVAENYLNLGNYEQVEYWGNKTLESQPEDTYMGEYYLMEVYTRTGQMEKMRELYESMKAQDEASLSKYQNTYNMLHSMSINLQDFEMTTYYFEKFSEYFGEYGPVIGNQAVFFVNTGNIPEAVPLMRRALELDPAMPLGNQFRQIMSQYPNL